MTSWRRFAFFTQREHPESEAQWVRNESVCASCALDDGRLVVADRSGVCHVLEGDALLEVASFGAHDRGVTHLAQPRGSGLLFTLGAESDGPTPRTFLRIWPTAAVGNSSPPPLQCARALRVFSGAGADPAVSSWCVADDCSQVALGLADGSVLLMRTSDVLRERFLKFKPLPSVKPAPSGVGVVPAPVKAVFFCYGAGERTPTDVWLLRRDALMCVSGGGMRHETCRTLAEAWGDNAGADGAGCACVSDAQQLVLGRPEAVYFYSTEERGSCFAFTGRKLRVDWHRSFLLLLSMHGNAVKQEETACELQLVDLKAKSIAYSLSLTAPPRCMINAPDRVVLSLADGRVLTLSEKPPAVKLDLLFRKSLYSTALALAHSQGYDAAMVAEIHRRHAEHLYDKGDVSGAASEYIHTLGTLEPSRVIPKFLDAARISHLTRYLQALQDDPRGLAGPQHSTLLLTCYAKLKEHKSLEALIESYCTGNARSLDVQSAIDVCRKGGYAHLALRLAEVDGLDSRRLQLLLHDAHDYDGALKLISGMGDDPARDSLMQNGALLLKHRPAQTTALLIKCCASLPQRSAVYYPPGTGGGMRKEDGATVHEFIKLFSGDPCWLEHFLERLLERPPQPPIVTNTLLELYLSGGAAAGDSAIGKGEGSARDPPPRLGGAKKTGREKAMALLRQQGAGYSDEQALLLCKQYKFEEGAVHMYEKLGRHDALLQHLMDTAQHDAVVRLCRQTGEQLPHLWVEALRYFACADEQMEAYIPEVIAVIEREQMLPPMAVLELLGQGRESGPGLPLSIAREYLLRHLQADEAMIRENEREAKRFEEDTARMQAEIKALTSQPRTFQQSNCAACQTPLDLPTVNFLCMHSFHQACLGDNDSECILCAPQRRRVREHLQQQQQLAVAHDDFFKQLEQSTDGFGTISEYIGRGMLCNINRMPR
ncbi:hypothetical protein AB1Y20_000820 [Prymnesium parvum]|uniref:Vacuolar protein sorting-associated protein 11 homolog n=1 Tax=Prymnesium parvum TaxID=97485 RepID=A0AB34KAT6_PRYPA